MLLQAAWEHHNEDHFVSLDDSLLPLPFLLAVPFQKNWVSVVLSLVLSCWDLVSHKLIEMIGERKAIRVLDHEGRVLLEPFSRLF